MLSAFVLSTFGPLPSVQAQDLALPPVGAAVALSRPYSAPMVTGLTIHPKDPLKFDFIIDTGDGRLEGEAFKAESMTLIKYFMAALTVPENELWVNLSPYEKDRIMADGLSQTDMGRDMLAQDYILKQLTASLVSPENTLGRKFWDGVYAQARSKYGDAELPVDTFNKIWIVPDQATVYFNGTSAFVVENHLKVMLEEDYLAVEKNGCRPGDTFSGRCPQAGGRVNERLNARATEGSNRPTLVQQILRDTLLPAIEHEVNHGKNFAQLRQIFNSMILATWFKRNLRQNLLGKIYADQNKVQGIDLEQKHIKEKIYNQYLQALKKGVHNFIKEEYDPQTKTVVPRKYFSGGIEGVKDLALKPPSAQWVQNHQSRKQTIVEVRMDAAMTGSDEELSRRRFLQIMGGFLGSRGLIRPVVGSLATPAAQNQLIKSILTNLAHFYAEIDEFMDFIHGFTHPNADNVVDMSYLFDNDIPIFMALVQPISKEKLDVIRNGLESNRREYFSFFTQDASRRRWAIDASRNDAKLDGLDWDHLSSAQKSELALQKFERAYQNIIDTVNRSYPMTNYYPLLIESVRANPEISRFANAVEKYFQGKMFELEADPVWQDFMMRFGRPLLESHLNYESRKEIFAQWRVQKRIWAAEYQREHARTPVKIVLEGLRGLLSSASQGKSPANSIELVLWKPAKGGPKAALLSRESGQVKRTFLRQEYVRELLSMLPVDQPLAPGEFKRVAFDRPMGALEVGHVLRKALSTDAAMTGRDDKSPESKRRWWQRIFGEVRNSKNAPADPGSIQVDRRTVFRLMGGAAAAAGAPASAVQTLLGQGQGLIGLTPATYADLIISQSKFHGFVFFRDFAGELKTIYEPKQKIDIDRAFGNIHRTLPAILAELWKNSENDEVLGTLPTLEQMAQLRDFFLNDSDGKNFARFSQNPVAQELAPLTNVFFKGVVPGLQDQPLDFQLKALFQVLGKMMQENYQAMQDLLSFIEVNKRDPRFSEFAYLFEDYLKQGRSVLENSGLFQEFLREFWEPARQIGSDWTWGFLEDNKEKMALHEQQQAQLSIRWEEFLQRLAARNLNSPRQKASPISFILYPLITQISSRAPVDLIIRRKGRETEAYLQPQTGRPFLLRDEYVRELLAMMPSGRLPANGYKKVAFDQPMGTQEVDYVLRRALSDVDAAMNSNNAGRQRRWTNWWRKFVKEVKDPPADDGPQGHIKISRRQVLQMAAGVAAASGINLNGVTPLLAQLPETISISPTAIIDLMLGRYANFDEYFKNIYTFHMDLLLMSYETFPELINSDSNNIAFALTEFWDGEDPFGGFLPAPQQMAILADFFESDSDGSHFQRFIQNPGVQQQIFDGHIMKNRGDRQRWSEASPRQKRDFFQLVAKASFKEHATDVRNAADMTARLPHLVAKLRKDPYYWKFAGALEDFLERGRPALEENEVFQAFLRDYWLPRQRLLEESNNASEEQIREIEKKLNDLQRRWEEQLDQWADEYRRSHPDEDVREVQLYPLIPQISQKTPLNLIIRKRTQGQIEAYLLPKQGARINLRQEYVRKLLALLPPGRELSEGEVLRIAFEKPMPERDVFHHLLKELRSADGDKAMAGQLDKGGIDLNPANLSLKEKGQKPDWKPPAAGVLNIDPAQMTGLRPVILRVYPVKDFLQLLGPLSGA